MRIVDIREIAVPLKSKLANSSFDFTEMTTSVVAVITDVRCDGKPVCGFAFNSTGRYACGAQMRARFIPRILSADPDALLDDSGTNLDPAKILAVMMKREKAGGHSERSIAIGTIEVAIWDAVAKIAGKPLSLVLAERFCDGRPPDKVFCYVGGGWYWPGQTIRDLQDEMRQHLDAGYTLVKMKVGGLPLAEDVRRLEAVIKIMGSGKHIAVDANCKFDRAEALRYVKTLAQFKLRWFEEPCDPLDLALFAELASIYDAAGDRREPLLHSGCREPGTVRRLPSRPRHYPDRSAAGLWHRPIRQDARYAGEARLAADVAIPARRQPDVASDSRRIRPRRRGVLSRGVRRFRRFRRRCPHRKRRDYRLRSAWHRFRGSGRALSDHARAGGILIVAPAIAEMQDPKSIRIVKQVRQPMNRRRR